MIKTMRKSTLATLGLGNVLDIFQQGKLPVTAAELIDKIFGPASSRRAMVISGANGIVGAGKTMQFASRLQSFGIPIVALDLGNAPDGIGKQYKGLADAFGQAQANKIMENVIRLAYDGSRLPDRLKDFKPKFLLEAIPEILELKKSHYQLFKAAFPDIEIRSVTSGFPASQLGVGIAHPAFPHEVNKVFEIVEGTPSPITQLFWALGLIPMPVGDHWSFVLDVLFCGLTLAASRYHHASNMPFWKTDKYVRHLLGPNPLRAHDAIGAKGANFLTWSCLYHLTKEYGDLFKPTPELEERKESGQNWYPPDHFRPLVNWSLNEQEKEEFDAWILGPLCQMASLMLHENRAHFSYLNSIGEICAQFRRGILAVIRRLGTEASVRLVEKYHSLNPSARQPWYPEEMQKIGEAAWQQLYVNAEHNGDVGVITIGRESYNKDVDAELNRAIDWLHQEKIHKVIVTGDFHLATQLVGADTSEFFPALQKVEAGFAISQSWSQTARRLYQEFATSVAFIHGKRCLGGFLELMVHCHYLVAVDSAELGTPEVTLPVVPGMEGCHWPFRKTAPVHWSKLMHLLLGGKPVKARDSVGWLSDFAGQLDESLRMAWQIASQGNHNLPKREVAQGSLAVDPNVANLPPLDDPLRENGRKAIAATIVASCKATLAEALDIQARHSANFMASPDCLKGKIGAEAKKA
jgi:enoyl-CoA hydratase/carnithine racemase